MAMSRENLEARARDRAISENVRIAPMAGTNGREFLASSITTEPGAFWHLWVDVAGDVSCSCPAGKSCKPCKHSEAVKMHLYEARMVAEAQARQQRDMAGPGRTLRSVEQEGRSSAMGTYHPGPTGTVVRVNGSGFLQKNEAGEERLNISKYAKPPISMPRVGEVQFDGVGPSRRARRGEPTEKK